MKHGVANVDCSFSAKRPGAGQHFVKQHSERKDVGALVHAIAARLFGCGVSRGSVRHADFGEFGAVNTGRRGFGVVEEFGQTEVEHLCNPVPAHHYVVRLDIPMNDSCHMRARQRRCHLQRNVSIDVEPEEGHASIDVEDLGPTPFEQLATHEIQSAVQNALSQVPEVFRSAVILRDLEGLSYEEIAEVLECSVGTVKSRILRGRRALKDLLEPLLVDRSAVAHQKDRSAGAGEDDRSAIAREKERPAIAHKNGHSAKAHRDASAGRGFPGSRVIPRERFTLSQASSSPAEDLP